MYIAPTSEAQQTDNKLIVSHADLTDWDRAETDQQTMRGLASFVRTYNDGAVDLYGYQITPSLGQFRANGTPAAPAALQSGDIIVNLTARGYGSTGWSGITKGNIRFTAAANWTDASQPTRMSLAWSPVNLASESAALSYLIGEPNGRLVHNLQPQNGGDPLATGSFVGIGAPGVSYVDQRISYGANATFSMYRANGTLTAPTAVQSGNIIANIVGAGYDGTSWGSVPVRGSLRMAATENWSSSAHGTRVYLLRTPNGGSAAYDGFGLEQDGALSQAGQIFQYADRSGQERIYLSNALPNPTLGRRVYVSDISKPCWGDGAAWKDANGAACP